MGSKLCMYMNKRAKYLWKWPTTLKSVWPCVQVLIISYFDLCDYYSAELVWYKHFIFYSAVYSYLPEYFIISSFKVKNDACISQ